MPSIDKAFYSQFAPVFNEPGRWETGAQGYGSVFFRNTIYQADRVEITVGIAVYPSSWYYSASYSTPGLMRAIDVPRLPQTTPWPEVRDYYLNHGLAAYGTYKKDLAARIESCGTRIAGLKTGNARGKSDK